MEVLERLKVAFENDSDQMNLETFTQQLCRILPAANVAVVACCCCCLLLLLFVVVVVCCCSLLLLLFVAVVVCCCLLFVAVVAVVVCCCCLLLLLFVAVVVCCCLMFVCLPWFVFVFFVFFMFSVCSLFHASEPLQVGGVGRLFRRMDCEGRGVVEWEVVCAYQEALCDSKFEKELMTQVVVWCDVVWCGVV